MEQNLNSNIRKNIIDGLLIENVDWKGILNDVEFLSRIYKLSELPSKDNRYEDAAGDIWQQRINNNDWDDNWIFKDERFNLLSGAEEEFLKFLCEIVHPAVRPDKEEAIKLVKQINDQLAKAGWSLVQKELIAGRPRYAAHRISKFVSEAFSRAKNAADALDAGNMHKEIVRMEEAIESDPALAIGTAKEFIESCCKTILTNCGKEFTGSADIPKLTKLVAEKLSLVSNEISDEVKGAEIIRKILGNFSALAHNVAELRSLYGSGHGREGSHKGLEPRHARLAVAAAVAYVDFVTETYHKKSK